MTTRALTDLLGIDRPIVLGPFGGLSSVALTAAVSSAGGLGSYGLYGYDGARIRETIASLRAATDRPFAVNLWLPTGDEVTPDAVDLRPARAALAPVFAELGAEVPEPPERFLPEIAEQLDAVLDGRPAALSLVYGVPSPDLVDAARRRGIAVIGTATTVAEARALADAGVDAVVATGAEAAGHRVSFLQPAERSLVGTFALVPQVVDAVDVPVIAAGGIADRRGVAAAFALDTASAALAAPRVAAVLALTDDHLFGGKIRLLQPRRGHRARQLLAAAGERHRRGHRGQPLQHEIRAVQRGRAGAARRAGAPH